MNGLLLTVLYGSQASELPKPVTARNREKIHKIPALPDEVLQNVWE
jgi:hypothetical protein